MSLRTIMIFPEFENMYVIDPVRNRYDPLAKLVRPHITIVFPFESDMSNEELSGILDRRLASFGPFDIEMQGFAKHSVPAGNYLFLNMTKGAEEIKKIHEELYKNEFAPYGTDFEYEPHMTVGKLETEAALDDAFSTVKYKRDVFACRVNKISVEMIGEHEESIIILEKELKRSAAAPANPVATAAVAAPAAVTGEGREPAASESRVMDAEFEKIVNCLKSGDYVRASSLMKLADGSRDPACYILIKLLCAYRVSSTEELLKKLSLNVSLTRHLLTRDDIKDLCTFLSPTDNRLDAHIFEYSLLALRLSGLSCPEICSSFITGAKSSGRSGSKSAFAKMDSEDTYNYDKYGVLQNKREPYEFDFFEELSDIGVKYKSAVTNPDRNFESVTLANLSLIGDLFILGNRAAIDANPNDDGRVRYVSEHDYGVNKPPVTVDYESYGNAGGKTEDLIVVYCNELENKYPTDEAKQARLEELTGLIRQEEEKILKGTYRQ